MVETLNSAERVRPLERLNRLSPQAVFLLIAGFFGLAMAIITPPVEVPDEPAHWLRIYQLSQGTMLSTNYGGDVVNSIMDFSWRPWSLQPGHPNVKTSIRLVLNQFKVPLEPDKTHFAQFPNTSLYCLVPYVTATPAMLIARKLDLPPIALMYFGRIGTLIGYLLIGWATIRIAPILKWPACMALTSPMSIFLAGSLSADAMTIAFVFLATAIALWCMFSTVPLTSATILWLTLAMVAAGLCKSAYAPVVLLVFAVPRDKWGTGHRRWAIPLMILLLTTAAVAGWSILSKASHVREIADLPSEQLHWVLYHPGHYAGIVRRTLMDDGPIWLSSVGYLGWLDAHLLPTVIDLMYAGFAWLVLAYGEPQPMPRWTRSVAGVALVASVGLIMTANYMVWNKVGAPTIQGLQGRYLLPCALLAAIVFRRKNGYPVRTHWMILLLGGLAFYSVWVVVERFYLPQDLVAHLLSGARK